VCPPNVFSPLALAALPIATFHLVPNVCLMASRSARLTIAMRRNSCVPAVGLRASPVMFRMAKSVFFFLMGATRVLSALTAPRLLALMLALVSWSQLSVMDAAMRVSVLLAMLTPSSPPKHVLQLLFVLPPFASVKLWAVHELTVVVASTRTCALREAQTLHSARAPACHFLIFSTSSWKLQCCDDPLEMTLLTSTKHRK